MPYLAHLIQDIEEPSEEASSNSSLDLESLTERILDEVDQKLASTSPARHQKEPSPIPPQTPCKDNSKIITLESDYRSDSVYHMPGHLTPSPYDVSGSIERLDSALSGANIYPGQVSPDDIPLDRPKGDEGIIGTQDMRSACLIKAQRAYDELRTTGKWPPPLPEALWVLQRLEQEARAASSQRTRRRRLKRQRGASSGDTGSKEDIGAKDVSVATERSKVKSEVKHRRSRSQYHPKQTIDRYRPGTATVSRRTPQADSKEKERVMGPMDLPHVPASPKISQGLPWSYNSVSSSTAALQDEEYIPPASQVSARQLSTPRGSLLELPLAISLQERDFSPPNRPLQTIRTVPNTDRYRPSYTKPRSKRTRPPHPWDSARKKPSPEDGLRFEGHSYLVGPKTRSRSRSPEYRHRGRGGTAFHRSGSPAGGGSLAIHPFTGSLVSTEPSRGFVRSFRSTDSYPVKRW